MKQKIGRPRGSGPAQLVRAVLTNAFYLAVKELEQRGTPLSELLAEQLDADPLGTLTKLKAYLPSENIRAHPGSSDYCRYLCQTTSTEAPTKRNERP